MRLFPLSILDLLRGPPRILKAVFTITLGCSAIKRRLEPGPMSGRSDMEDSLGHPDLAPDCDRD